MKEMIRNYVYAGTLFLAILALASNAVGAQQNTVSDLKPSIDRGANPRLEAQGCGTFATGEEPADDDAKWRLRAYRHIDCVVGLVDRAQNGTGDVRLSREEADRLRTWALWAKDAAQRIGRQILQDCRRSIDRRYSFRTCVSTTL